MVRQEKDNYKRLRKQRNGKEERERKTVKNGTYKWDRSRKRNTAKEQEEKVRKRRET